MAPGAVQGKFFSMKLIGYDKVTRNIKLAKTQGVKLQKFLEAEGEKVRKTAMQLVPYLTGRLKDSHRVVTFGATGKHVIMVYVIAGGKIIRGKLVNYAAAVHFGRGPHKGNPRPWLDWASKVHSIGYRQRMAKAIKGNLKRVGIKVTR